METEHYRALLLKRRAALASVADEGAAAAATVELDQTRVGRLSRMDALQGQAMARATAGRRQLELTRIDSALARIDEGRYGICVRCGEDIAPARLAVDPAAVVCVDCAGDIERGKA